MHSELPLSFSNKSVFQFSMGETLLSKNLTGDGVSVYSSDLSTLPWGKTTLNTRTYKKGDIVIGARGTIGSIKMPNEDNFTATQTTMVCSIINKEIVLSDFLYYFLHTVNWRSITSGATIPMLTINAIKNIEIPLFDIDTQSLIVSGIEKQFSRLDEGLSSLVRTRENLKSYRASLLKSAVEGRLTAEWRANHLDIESADILLDRIRTTRREKWIMENPGKKYKEPEKMKEGIEGLEQLPKGWTYINVGSVADARLGKMLDKAKNKGELFPYLANISVRWGNFDLDNLSEMRFEEDEFEKFGIKDGDLIICEGGEPGRSAIWKEQVPNMMIQKALHRVRFYDGVSTEYFSYFLKYFCLSKAIEKYFTGTTIKHFTGESLDRFIFSLPPLLEQHHIVEILEEKFSVIDSLESLVNANIRRAENLKQAILKKAFSGELISE